MPLHEGGAMEHVEAALLLLQPLEGQLPLRSVGKQLKLAACSRSVSGLRGCSRGQRAQKALFTVNFKTMYIIAQDGHMELTASQCMCLART